MLRDDVACSHAGPLLDGEPALDNLGMSVIGELHLAGDIEQVRNNLDTFIDDGLHLVADGLDMPRVEDMVLLDPYVWHVLAECGFHQFRLEFAERHGLDREPAVARGVQEQFVLFEPLVAGSNGCVDKQQPG